MTFEIWFCIRFTSALPTKNDQKQCHIAKISKLDPILRGGVTKMATKGHEKHEMWFFSYFFRTRICLKFMYAEYRNVGPRIKNMKNQTKFFALPKCVSVTFSTLCVAKMAKDPVKPENFRNLSNFEKLYLRAQWIFFQNSKRSWKVYIWTLKQA